MKDKFTTFVNGILEIVKTYKGDWKESNPSSPNYIKNRTHWIDEEKIDEIVLNETIFIEDEYAMFNTKLLLNTDRTYYVTLNGVEYICKPWIGYEDNVCIGNGNIYGGDGMGDLDYPFSCDSYYYDKNIYLNVNSGDEGEYHVVIREVGVVETIHKIDKKYLPTTNTSSGAVIESNFYAEYITNFKDYEENYNLSSSTSSLMERLKERKNQGEVQPMEASGGESEQTYTCTNMTFDEAWEIITNNGELNITLKDVDFEHYALTIEPCKIYTVIHGAILFQSVSQLGSQSFYVWASDGLECISEESLGVTSTSMGSAIHLYLTSDELNFIKTHTEGLFEYESMLQHISRGELNYIYARNINTVIFDGYEDKPYKVVSAYIGFNGNEKVILERAIGDSSDDGNVNQRLIIGYSDDMGQCYMSRHYGDYTIDPNIPV